MKKAILLIEDNPLLTGLYSAGFKKEGMNVYVVHNGEDGLKMMEELDPDIVLLDLFMPGMDGIQVLEKMRSNPRTKDIKVIVLTINDKEDVKTRAKELGIVDYLLKQEMHLDEIIKRVVAHLS
jgi:DNA-binding response OmpR family regulator